MAKPEAAKKIRTSFPSYQRWENFLKQQPPEIVVLPTDPTFQIYAQTSFKTPTGTLNEVGFQDIKYCKGIDLHPYLISQEYSNRELGYEVETNLKMGDLSVTLQLESKSKLIDYVTIESSQSALKGGDFTVVQGIFIMLKDEYKKKLIKRGIIPKNAENFIGISDSDGVRSVKIETNLRTGTELSEEKSLRIIKQEIDFDWEMNGEETKGTFGDKYFNVKHVNPLSLDPESVWDSLTGKEGKQFIFPVEVKKIDSK